MYEYLDRRYAQALYDVARQKDSVDKYIKDLEEIDEMIHNNPDIAGVVKHPEIPTKEKKKFFINILKGRVDEDLLTFILLLIEKDRILFLKEKIRELKKIDLENKNIKIASITVARPLNDRQRAELTQKLEKKYNVKIILDEMVDESIIGGMVIRIGDSLMDGSIRKKMEEVKSALLKRLR